MQEFEAANITVLSRFGSTDNDIESMHETFDDIERKGARIIVVGFPSLNLNVFMCEAWHRGLVDPIKYTWISLSNPLDKYWVLQEHKQKQYSSLRCN